MCSGLWQKSLNDKLVNLTVYKLSCMLANFLFTGFCNFFFWKVKWYRSKMALWKHWNRNREQVCPQHWPFLLCLISRARYWPSWERGADPNWPFLQIAVCHCLKVSFSWDWNSNSQDALLNPLILVMFTLDYGWKMVRGRESWPTTGICPWKSHHVSKPVRTSLIKSGSSSPAHLYQITFL